jgi:predicted signal transduction protein with EAL and GGDEF domain
MKSYVETLFRWASPKAGGLPKRPANFITTVETGKLVLQEAQPLIKEIEQMHDAGPPKRWWGKDDRVSKTTEELELTITEAVKATPGCEAFVGVIVRRTTQNSRLDANWEIRAIKFGGMDRQIAREALTPIVERMQREFRLTDYRQRRHQA